MALREEFLSLLRQRVAADPELQTAVREEADYQQQLGAVDTAAFLRCLIGEEKRPSEALEAHRDATPGN